MGKTGKDGLKRRCLEYDPQTLADKMDIAGKAKAKMAAFELDDVRDVSAGAATFYLWVSGTKFMINICIILSCFTDISNCVILKHSSLNRAKNRLASELNAVFIYEIQNSKLNFYTFVLYTNPNT